MVSHKVLHGNFIDWHFLRVLLVLGIFNLHVIGMEAYEIFVQVESKTFVLLHININVVMVRVVFLSIVTDTLHKQLVN